MAQNTDGIISKYLDKLEMLIDTEFIGKIWDENKDAYDFKTGKDASEPNGLAFYSRPNVQNKKPTARSLN